ncbi:MULTISPECIES: rhomboid family intramembrane serine protease [unclassified Butyrivibrio]|uniref:rhomboid family intramembrane serine protease n=1 Tax=unclassified Butyrivibrio TaxID=2639466 RepID=UPI000479505A|nr:MULTISPECIES: rhomboid family intramembrane serine protease [unclassified Butyrivibrio]
MESLRIAEYPVTYGIIAINILIFILLNTGKLDVSRLGSSYINSLQEKQYYRIVTAAFTQKEFLHLLCNMYSLYNIGRTLEHVLESWLFAVCYAVIMLCGGFMSARIHKKISPFTLCIGASGVICGLLGIYMVIAFSVRGFSGLKSMIPTMVLLALMTTSRKIDSIGHFAGLLVGIICGIVMVSVYSFG